MGQITHTQKIGHSPLWPKNGKSCRFYSFVGTGPDMGGMM
jgi:hypothetical protein